MRAGFPGQQLWNFLIQLNLGNNDPDMATFDGVDQRMQMPCRRFSSRLSENRAGDLQIVAPGKIGPRRVMDDDGPVRHLFESLQRLFLNTQQGSQIVRRVAAILCCMGWVGLRQGLGNMLYHRGGRGRIQPHVRIAARMVVGVRIGG